MASAAGTPMLFLPSQPPLPLPGDGTIVIGRGSEADLQLNDFDTSRRHAQIVCTQQGFTLQDLGSTNGTWVNGSRIEKHVLKAGDRIEIGESLIAFCLVRTQFGEGPDDSVSTLFREQPEPSWTREAFRGDLAEIPPYAVLQILELGNKTGELLIESESATGSLWLRQGDPVHAEAKGLLGFDAAMSLATVTSGNFTFEPKLEVPDATIEASVTQLLLEASRLKDEENL